MLRVTFTLMYIVLISAAANINKVRGNMSAPSTTVLELPAIQDYQKSSSLPKPLVSGSVNIFPEPAAISLFGFGFLMVIGFGWIKKSPNHE